MNVTLNITADFEDIPVEISHLLQQVKTELVSAATRAENISQKLSVENVDNEEAMELMHNVRLHMAKIDTRMEDCMSILNGYAYYLENPPEAEEGSQEQEASDEEG